MKKRLLSLLMALVLTLGFTGTCFATDEPALAGYTKENSFHAVKDFYESTYPARYGPSSRNSDPQPRDPELLAAYESGQRQLPTGFQSPFGTLRETWGYLAEHYTFDIADGWLEENFSSSSQDGGAAFLNYVARGDFDRHFAYILAVYGPNYFRLRDAGDAVGFEVGWSAQAGITAQTTQPKMENPWDLPELPTQTVFHDDIMGRIITTTSETDSRGKETVTTVLETAALKEIMTITKDMSTVGRQSTKTKRLDAARPIPAPTARQVTITANGKSVTLDALVLLDSAGNETNYFKLRDLGAALGFQVNWSAETGITVTTD